MVRPSTALLRAGATALLVIVCSSVGHAQTCSVLHEFNGSAGFPFPLLALPDGRLLGTAANEGDFHVGNVFLLTPDGLGGFDYQTIYSFSLDTVGRFPWGRLTPGDDGLYYGMTTGGGSADNGTVFRVDDAGNLEFIHELGDADGFGPGELLLADDGDFYGSLYGGSVHGGGVIFRMTSDGSMTRLKDFELFEGHPSRLIQGPDGNLYGVLRASFPPFENVSSVFRMATDGTGYTVLHHFGVAEGVALWPLVEGADGKFYGTLRDGDTGFGSFFRIDSSGALTIIHALTQEEGWNPQGGLLRGSDDKLYGMTSAGGPESTGSFFRIDTSGNFELLGYLPADRSMGMATFDMLAETDDGFFGPARSGGAAEWGTLFHFDAAGVPSLVQEFAVGGHAPLSGVIEASDGKIYGATPGATAAGGTIFRMEPGGAYETFHSFTNLEGFVLQPPVELSPGLFVGSAPGGGPHGFGTLYSLDGAGGYELIHDFGPDPFTAPAEIFRASDGNFYGVSSYQVLRLDALGAAEPVASVESIGFPENGLTEGSDEALYGATSSGGAHGYGAIFRVSLAGDVSTVHDFSGLDGFSPNGGLLADADGYLYGTTLYGGPSGGLGSAAGTVFRVHPSGGFESLYAFSLGVAGDGEFCNGHLMRGSDGFLYGTTRFGGTFGRGTVYRLDAGGAQTLIHSFTGEQPGSRDGSSPRSGLLEASNGLLYGTTERGGGYLGGTVFRIDTSKLVPVISVSPSSGPASGGTAVTIAGSGFADGAVVRLGFSPAVDVAVPSAAGIDAKTPALEPGILYHLSVVNPDQTEGTLSGAFLADFSDVPQSDIYHSAVEKILRDGVTAGCGAGNYCRDGYTTRSQMAVFLLKSLLGRHYNPPTATGTVFSDVLADDFAAAWIEDLARRGVTAGCGSGLFCPNGFVTRAQMAVFLLKTLLGTAYVPPAAVGIFGDVAVGSFAADWIEDLYTRGITAGCSPTVLVFCPAANVTRGQMAAFLVRTFSLP